MSMDERRSRLGRETERMGPAAVADMSILRGLFGEWVHYEAGPNYAEVGLLEDCWIDEIGRVIACFNKVRRRANETDEDGPSWLCKNGWNSVRIPTTAIINCCPAKDRYGDAFKPW